MKGLNILFRISLIIIGILFLLDTSAFCNTSAPPCADTVKTNVSCYGGNDGSVTITINNGTAPYTFTILLPTGPLTYNSPVSKTHTFTNLSAGDYLIVTQYTNGAAGLKYCTPSIVATITEPDSISTTATVTNNNCNGGNAGAIDLTVSGGSPGYTYSWNNGAYITEDLSNLSAGNYTVIVRDSKGCKDTSSYTVTAQAPILIPGVVTDVKCNGGNTGSIDITPSGGTAPYTYSWNDPLASTTQDISSLAAGTYTVTVKDINNCTTNTSFTVNQPLVISIPGTTINVLCNGGNNGSIDITPAGGTSPYTYSWSNGATTQDISSLIAGTYTITVKDANLCTQNASFTITQPTAITIPGTTTNNICNGGSAGSIDITPAGGTGAYTYLWSNGATTQDISGLTAGSYTITIKDANLCSQNASFTITDPLVISIPGTITLISCNGGNNGAIDITPAGGTGAYTYLWSNGATTQDISGLIAGTYTVTVKDANLCSKSASFTISQPAAITIPGIVTNVSCNAGNNGAIDITPAGGTGAYTYVWSNGATTQDISSLVAGTYTVTVKDANLCSKNATFTVTQPSAITIPGITTNVTCNGGSNGTIDITPAGGTGAYTYTWSNGATTQDISGLAAGLYTVIVKDAKNCSKIASFTITQPAAITIPGTTTDNICNGGSAGSIDITPANGTAPYTYLWSNGATTQDISGLTAGTYTVTVKDVNLCSKNASFTINDPIVISIPGTTTPVSCNGGSNGAIDITPAGGTGAYTYSWSNGATTQDISGLIAGTYTVTVKDANLCSKSASFTISQPVAITISGTTTPVSCNAGSDGAIDITPAGGTGAYTYSWSNGATTQDISGLAAGSYTVTVKDANLCSQNASFTITQPAAITIPGTTTNITCNGGSNGAIDITPAGGTGAYTYVWSNGATTQDISGLAAGSYTVTVKDANLCSQNASFTITQPAAITIPGTTTDNICNGGSAGAIDITPANGTAPYTYLWSNGATTQDISGLTAGTYTVTVKDVNLCSKNASFTINDPIVISIPGTTTPVSCNGGSNGAIDIAPAGGTGAYTYTWSNGATTQDISGLIAGTYTVTVKDANSCTQNASFTISQPVAITISGTTTPVSCNAGSDGAIDITPAGGTGAYTYVWSNGATTQDISGLAAGSYTVTVKDANLCSQNASFTITQPVGITIPGTTTNITCNGGSNGAIDITPAGGTGAYTYVWSNGATTQDISGLAAGSYTVTVKDANLCSQNASFTITQPAAITIPGTTTNNICNGGSAGAIDITPANGTAPYTYLWSNGPTTQDISGLTAGTYSVTVKDANLCSQNASFTINEPVAIAISGVVTDASCNGGSNGAIDITPANGTGPGTYTFLWSNGASTEDISGLTIGTYTVTVTDGNSCSQNASFTVNQSTIISVPGTVTDVTCNGASTGAIDITPAGGTGPGTYTFLWSNTATSEDISGLTAGSYSVTVTDGNSCSQNVSFTINQPAAITIPGSVTDVSCNGGNNGAIDITPAGGTAPYSFVWSNTATTEDVSGLTAGTYSVTVTDANSCTKNASFTVNEPLPISITANITDVTCNGGANGALDITVTGGNGPYTYSWSNLATSQDIASLTAGAYTVTVTDATLCTANATFTVNEPVAIAIPGVVTDASCNGGSNGAIDITPANGTGPGTYTFLWSNGASTEDISGLTIGTYTVTVTDGNSCSQNASFTVNQSTIISVPGTVTDVTCNGASTGAIDITPAGGTGPGTYTFLWSNTATSEDISGLTAGSYSVTVTDGNSCSQNVSFTINQPAAITIPGSVTDVSCNGGNNGAIDITPAGGTAPYSFVWSNTATTEDVSGLTAGTYSVTVTDANSCTQNASFTVNEPLAISITSNTTDVTCNGGANGALDITVTGGNGPYTYSWSNLTTSQDIASLTAGAYTVTVTDATLCTANATFTVNEPAVVSGSAISNPDTICLGNSSMVTASFNAAFTPAANGFSFDGGLNFGASNTFNIPSVNSDTSVMVVLKDVNGCLSAPISASILVRHFTAYVSLVSPLCNGDNTGSITVDSIKGGTSPYNYTLNGNPGVSFTNLTAGSYTLSVTDALSCRFDTLITLTEPSVLTLSATFQSPICSYGNNGSVTLNAAGGTPTYTYSNDNITFVASNVFSGLNPGTYTYYVKDGNGCTKTTTAVFASFPPINIASINANIINLTCNTVNSGQIHLSNITGGTRPFTFSLNGGVAQSDSSFIGLGAASQTISITDANGCSFPYNFTITAPPAITAGLTLKKFETCNNSDGEFYLFPVSGGVPPYKYSLNGGPQIAYPNDTVYFSNKVAAIYTVQVFDSSIPGCSYTQSIIIPKKPAPIPYVRVIDPLCYHGNDGQIRIDSLQGGAPLFNITLTGYNLGTTATASGVTSTVFNGLAKDSFQLSVTDQECTYPIFIYYLYNKDSLYYDTIVYNYIKVNEPDTISGKVFSSSTDRNLSVGSAYLHDVIGGTGPYSYSMNLGGPYVAITTDTTTITGLGKGIHKVYIKDANGCIGVVEFNVNSAFYIPNLISPNGDNSNDWFEVVGLPRESELRIYNRWGSRVYENKSYDNSWNGDGNPDGTYYYDLVLPDGTVYKGWVEIIR